KTTGTFSLSTSAKIAMNDRSCAPIVQLFQTSILDSYSIALPIKTAHKENIHFILDKSMKDESYKLIVSKSEVRLTGNLSGLFYASQSLLQLIHEDANGKLLIPC